MKSETWKRMHVAGAQAMVVGIAMNGAIVGWLTAVPATGTECRTAPLAGTVIAQVLTLKAGTAAVIDARRAGTLCWPMDWVDKVRLVTPS